MNSGESRTLVSAAARLLTGKPPPREQIDIDRLIDLLLHHRQGPMASCQAGKNEGWRVRLEGGDALRRLDAMVMQARVRWMMAMRALEDALELLSSYRTVLFKGLAVAELYPEPHLRDPGDIDMLIHPEEFNRAAELLKGHGWEQQPTVHIDRPEKVASYYGFAEVFRHPDSPVILDLHRAPVDRTEPFWLDPGSIIEKRKRTTLAGGLSVYTPDLCDHLILLALHSVRHGHFRLGWSLDVYLACRAWLEDIDRETFINRCRKWRIERAVRIGIETSRMIYGTVRHPMDEFPVNRGIRRAVFRRSPEVIAHGHLVRRGGWRRLGAMVDLIEKDRDKIRYVLNTVFPARSLFSFESGGIPGWNTYMAWRIKTFINILRGK